MIQNQLINLSFFLISFTGLCFAQFDDFEDAPTRSTSAKVQSGSLEGVMIEKNQGSTPDAKEVTITFLLSKIPSAFFDFYDPEKKAIVLDLYDTKIGESKIDSIFEYPILGNKIFQTQMDLNKDVVGLNPDFRDVVRLIFNCNYNLPYDIEEEFGMISLKFKWDNKIAKQLTRSKNAIYWRIPLAMAVVGGASFASYKIWFEKSSEGKECPVCELGNPPPHSPPLP